MEEAVQQGQDAIGSWIMTAQQDGDPLPPPNFYPFDDDGDALGSSNHDASAAS